MKIEFGYILDQICQKALAEKKTKEKVGNCKNKILKWFEWKERMKVKLNEKEILKHHIFQICYLAFLAE